MSRTQWGGAAGLALIYEQATQLKGGCRIALVGGAALGFDPDFQPGQDEAPTIAVVPATTAEGDAPPPEPCSGSKLSAKRAPQTDLDASLGTSGAGIVRRALRLRNTADGRQEAVDQAERARLERLRSANVTRQSKPGPKPNPVGVRLDALTIIAAGLVWEMVRDGLVPPERAQSFHDYLARQARTLEMDPKVVERLGNAKEAMDEAKAAAVRANVRRNPNDLAAKADEARQSGEAYAYGREQVRSRANRRKAAHLKKEAN